MAARNPINISWAGTFPADQRTRPGVEEDFYIRQVIKPDVGIDGIDIGSHGSDMILPVGYPARNMPISYKTVRRQWPVIIPKGRLLSAKSINHSYSTFDQEIGVDSTGKIPVAKTLAQGWNSSTSTYDVSSGIYKFAIDDYSMYGEDRRFVITLANASRKTVNDSYTVLDVGRMVVDASGDPQEITAGVTAAGSNLINYAEVTYPRSPNVPIAFTRHEVFADIRGQYQYRSYDSSIEGLYPYGSLAFPYVQADGVTIEDADLVPGGKVYDSLINYFTFLPISSTQSKNTYDAIYGDQYGNYVLSPFPYTATGTITTTGANSVITGTGTAFTSELVVGDTVILDPNGTTAAETVIITSILSDTVATAAVVGTSAVPSALTGETMQVYPAKSTCHQVGRTIMYDEYVSKGIDWQILNEQYTDGRTGTVGSPYMTGMDNPMVNGQASKGISTELWKFITYIANTTDVALQDLINRALEGKFGMVNLMICPVSYKD